MKDSYGIAEQTSGSVRGWSVVWTIAAGEIPIDFYATEAEAQIEADRLLALAWAPEWADLDWERALAPRGPT
jgi:hypothetical protein